MSAKDRDAIQEIQKTALQGAFGILLVFMFDRLGRKDDETPFVVEWFVKQNIEVWSAVEGQQLHLHRLIHRGGSKSEVLPELKIIDGGVAF